MRDIKNKRTIEIDGVKYSVDKTFDGSPAVFQHIQNGHCVRLEDETSKTHISSLTAGDDNCIIIIAHKADIE